MRLVPVLAAILGLALVPTTAGAAAMTAVYDDAAGDAVYPHVDVRRVALLYEEPVIGIGVVTDWLIGGNRLAIYVDSDLNSASGWQGADYAFFYEKYIAGQSLTLGIWNGSNWLLATPSVNLSVGTSSVNMVFDRSQIGSPTRGINVFAYGGHAQVPGPGDSYSDRAPNSGSWRLDFQSAAPPPPPPPPPPALSLAEGRAVSRGNLQQRLGSRAGIQVETCTQRSATQVRCVAQASRGRFSWRGEVTVTGSSGATTSSFAGKRIDRVCQRRRAGGCVRTASW